MPTDRWYEAGMVGAMDRAREAALTTTGRGPMAGPDETGGHASSEDGLSRLIEVEARLESLLEKARADAALVVAAAEEQGRRAEAELDAELALLIRESVERAASECESALAQIHAQSASAAARFESIEGPAVDDLAHVVIDRLLQGPGADEDGPA
jgi:vacuolar-type H+-ATPase subunit H